MTRQSAGFTLVELLVALSLFAMISVTSLTLLRSSIDTQAALAGRMDRSAGIERVRALIADGLLSAQPQAIRTPGQAPSPAFTGAPDRMSFLTVAPGPSGTPTVTRLTLATTDGQLTLQRGPAGNDDPAVLIDNLAAGTFRFRGADGIWQSAWTPERPDNLPRAAELTVQQTGGPDIVMRFIVAPGWPEPERAPPPS